MEYHLHSPFEKIIIEKTINILKIEVYDDDRNPCISKKCDLKHNQLVKLYTNYTVKNFSIRESI